MKRQTLKRFLILVLSVCIAMALPGLSASADYLGEFTEGVSVGTVKFYSSALPITDVSLSSGGLPRGVQPTWNEDGVYITGTPKTSGSYSAEYLVTTSEGVQTASVSFNVAAAPEATTAPEETEKPAATEKPASAEIEITKHPSGEYVESGDDRDVKFIAKADNAEKIVWRLVSPDASNTVRCSEAKDYFPGLEVKGLDSDTLILKHVTDAMNGWYVEAQFWNGNTHRESAGARITIVDSEGNEIGAAPTANTAPAEQEKPAVTAAPAPDNTGGLPVDNDAKTANISVQPESVEIKAGDSHTLSVVATSPNNGSLSYQWYSAATDNINAALPIGGASDASYTIENASETAYYWAAVWNVKDGKRSQAVFSESAEVKLAVEATPTPLPTEEPEPSPERSGLIGSDVNFQLILFSVIGLLALMALIGVVIFLRKDSKNKEK